MTLTVKAPNIDHLLPDVASLKKMGGLDFIGAVSNTLSRYDMRSPAFNFAAKAKIITPLDKKAMFMYPEEAQGVIFAGIKAIREYEATHQVSQSTREKFILEETKDLLRNMNTDHQAPEYKSYYDSVMAQVGAKMTGIGSLAFTPVVGLAGAHYTVKSARVSFSMQKP